MMKDVYEYASLVISWLGIEEAGDRRGIAFIRYILRTLSTLRATLAASVVA